MPSRTVTLRPKQDPGSGALKYADGSPAPRPREEPEAASPSTSPTDATYLHALMESNPLAIVTLDLQRKVQMCNPAFERLFGYPAAEIRGLDLESLISPRGRGNDEMAGLIERTLAGGTVRATTQRRRRDGSLVDVQFIGVPVIVDGKATGSFGMYEDITERTRVENAQRNAEEKYRRIFERAIEGFFESTREGRFVTVNPAMARIAGYRSPAEMISEIHDIGTQLYADPATRRELMQGLERHGVLERFECQILRKDKTKIWVSMNVRAARNVEGRIVGWDGSAEDITERKRSELDRQVTTEIIHSVSVTDNLDDLLRLVHGALGKVLDAENCFVALYEDATGSTLR